MMSIRYSRRSLFASILHSRVVPRPASGPSSADQGRITNRQYSHGHAIATTTMELALWLWFPRGSSRAQQRSPCRMSQTRLQASVSASPSDCMK
ncbi:hypothetical protein MPTK1_1g12960 [Marchantia polymorpha subsp. ruderalis]|uniref:Uncharacterized protein n=2 Tax=Marchantia polymorpha TaxID=3197 RepID=A0AAF6APK2_MARPO|nr:hypothetical protein MARPO_0019s0066 [Marchantia polymorpha]BBM98372.1 hypothetical protein Mp_1g12960 [Marchantia polymorpha subsp. ruderalis]|eukprot:PTQ44639.1 hypothetical protein MARPO_0019s0066 [Marchantia polymorpha]